MNKLIYISLFSLLFAVSCKTTKRTVSTTVTSNSSKKDSILVVRDSVRQTKERIVRDTVIKIEQRSVRDTIRIKDLETSTTSGGKVLPRHHQKSANGVTSYVTVYPDGSLVYGCDADSLLLVVNNLIYEKEYYEHRTDSLSTLVVKTTQITETYVYQFIKKTTPAGALTIVLVALVIIVIAAMRVFKKFVL